MYRITLNRVHDSIRINEGNDTLRLFVDADPMRMVAGLSMAQKMLQSINSESTDEQHNEAALFFATAIFGKEQATELAEFYHNDAGCVISVCGKYFHERLGKLITKAQKKSK